MTTPTTPLTFDEAFNLLQQGTFGAKESELNALVGQTPASWLTTQFAQPAPTYSGQDRDGVDKWSPVYGYDFCASFPVGSPERASCGDQYLSPNPVRRDFFINAISGPAQLRQRVAYALSQICVISTIELFGVGTYGIADFQQQLVDKAFGTYSDVLRFVTLHPLMGRYLTLLHSDKADPNENYARELLQLFSLGVCKLNPDGSLQGGSCLPTYDNAKAREYAYALTGYMHPPGGIVENPNTAPGALNPSYIKGAMVSNSSRKDNSARSLLSGVTVPANSTAAQALDAVIQSIELHQNFAPFVSKALIQFLVTSNPSPAYVQRVATAFQAGVFAGFGTGAIGDLKATVAAILLDIEARSPAPSTSYGKVKEPTIALTSLIRGINGYGDGEEMGLGWSQALGMLMKQPFMGSPSVFNYYMPDYAIPATNGVLAPQFQIISPNSILGWWNFVEYLIYGAFPNGFAPANGIPGAVGTNLNYSSFTADAANPAVLTARLDRLLTGNKLSAAQRIEIQAQMSNITSASNIPNGSTVEIERVKMGVYLIASSAAFLTEK